MKLYVGNLSYGTTEDALREAFASHGDVVSVNVVKDKFTNQSKGFAFVEMTNGEEGRAAIQSLDGTELGGRRIKVDEARPSERDRGDRGGDRGGRRDRW